MSKITAFLKDVRVELAKVSWPTRKQTIQYTLVVIGMSLVFALFLGLLDLGFENVIRKIIGN